jgi:hypothetical protein
MRIILLLICTVTLLASTGCVFWGGRDRGGDRDQWQHRDHEDRPSGVDHREYPGDLDHTERR